jgi:ABC-2 type transport system permease protein
MFCRHLRNELLKMFGKKRTYIGFGTFLVLQNVMLLMFQFTRWQSEWERLLASNGYLAQDYISALTVAIVMLIPQVSLLMPLYVALVGGDLVAKEVEDGTVRMMLSRPISRFRLVFVKWLAGVIFSTVLVLVLGGTALGFARLWFPWRNMFVFFPGVAFVSVFSALSAHDGLQLYLCSHFFLIINSCAVFSLAFMFSCFNMKPAAATILCLTFMFINLVLEGIPFFERYQEWLLTYHCRSWLLVYAQPVPWERIICSLCVLLPFNLTAFIVAATAFQVRDIKS